jgi:hypothetical protein
VPGWRRRGLGLELVAGTVVIISIVSRFLGTRSGTRWLLGACAEQTMSTRSTTTWRWQCREAAVASVSQTSCMISTRTEARSAVIFLLPAPAGFSCRGPGLLGAARRLGFRLGFAAAIGPARRRSFRGVARMPSSTSWSLMAHASSSTWLHAVLLHRKEQKKRSTAC